MICQIWYHMFRSGSAAAAFAGGSRRRSGIAAMLLRLCRPDPALADTLVPHTRAQPQPAPAQGTVCAGGAAGVRRLCAACGTQLRACSSGTHRQLLLVRTAARAAEPPHRPLQVALGPGVLGGLCSSCPRFSQGNPQYPQIWDAQCPPF
jgi:hypothetical protein